MSNFQRSLLAELNKLVDAKCVRVEEGVLSGIGDVSITKGLMTKINAKVLELAEEYGYRVEEQDSYFSSEYGLKAYASLIGERDSLVSITIEPCAGFAGELYSVTLVVTE